MVVTATTTRFQKPGREMGHAGGLSRQTEQGQAQDQNHNQDMEEPDNNLREEEGGDVRESSP